MTLLRHELRRGRWALALWSVSIGLFIAVCVFLFPEMRGEMESVNQLFSSLGAFTAAFGMDRLSLGTLMGFYAVESGNILGLCGAFFAALTAVNALAREERDRTAEFLLSHPLGRARIVTEKLMAVLIQLAALNAVVLLISVASIRAIGEAVPWGDLMRIHLAHFLLQTELAGICFGISAFLRRGGAGIGIGITAALYFLNLIANISEGARFLKYITPYAFAEGADILANGRLDGALVVPGMLCGALGIAVAYWKYCGKDIG